MFNKTKEELAQMKPEELQAYIQELQSATRSTGARGPNKQMRCLDLLRKKAYTKAELVKALESTDNSVADYLCKIRKQTGWMTITINDRIHLARQDRLEKFFADELTQLSK